MDQLASCPSVPARVGEEHAVSDYLVSSKTIVVGDGVDGHSQSEHSLVAIPKPRVVLHGVFPLSSASHRWTPLIISNSLRSRGGLVG